MVSFDELFEFGGNSVESVTAFACLGKTSAGLTALQALGRLFKLFGGLVHCGGNVVSDTSIFSGQEGQSMGHSFGLLPQLFLLLS